MPGNGTINAVIILRRINEEYIAGQMYLYMCFLNLEKAFNSVPRKVLELAMRKKDIPEALVAAGMRLRIMLGMVKFRECQDIHCGMNYPLEIKPIACKCCVRSAMLYANETWSLALNDNGILQKTERAME